MLAAAPGASPGADASATAGASGDVPGLPRKSRTSDGDAEARPPFVTAAVTLTREPAAAVPGAARPPAVSRRSGRSVSVSSKTTSLSLSSHSSIAPAASTAAVISVPSGVGACHWSVTSTHAPARRPLSTTAVSGSPAPAESSRTWPGPTLERPPLPTRTVIGTPSAVAAPTRGRERVRLGR